MWCILLKELATPNPHASARLSGSQSCLLVEAYSAYGCLALMKLCLLGVLSFSSALHVFLFSSLILLYSTCTTIGGASSTPLLYILSFSPEPPTPNRERVPQHDNVLEHHSGSRTEKVLTIRSPQEVLQRRTTHRSSARRQWSLSFAWRCWHQYVPSRTKRISPSEVVRYKVPRLPRLGVVVLGS